MTRSTLADGFHHIAHTAAQFVGSAGMFVLALVLVGGWLLTGPLFGFSDTWQLIINTATTIITFLMVFLIQNTQNRDAQAIHLKLDELIRSIKTARNTLIDVEELSEEDLQQLQQTFVKLAKHHPKS